MSFRDKNIKQHLWQIIVFFVIGLLFVLVVPRFFSKHTAQVKTNDNIYSINSQEFVGFDKCELRPEFVAMTKRLFTEGKPSKREDNALFYNIKSEVMGIPVKTIVLGICDDGSQNCGWGTYVAVIVAKPLSKLREELKTKTGIDFTEELRGKEADETLRPVLTTTQNANESGLICDPGVL